MKLKLYPYWRNEQIKEIRINFIFKKGGHTYKDKKKENTGNRERKKNKRCLQLIKKYLKGLIQESQKRN